MFFFKKPKPIVYSEIIPVLETGDAKELKKLLWQPRKGMIGYLPVVVITIQKLKKPDGTSEHLSVYKVLRNGQFELVIFNIPWSISGVPYSPLVMDRRTAKIVGTMLPFNELSNHISKKASKQIGDLGVAWVSFILPYRFNK